MLDLEMDLPWAGRPAQHLWEWDLGCEIAPLIPHWCEAQALEKEAVWPLGAFLIHLSML